eukprot:321695-Pyramimonas_sp.AAC.1
MLKDQCIHDEKRKCILCLGLYHSAALNPAGKKSPFEQKLEANRFLSHFRKVSRLMIRRQYQGVANRSNVA